MSKNNRPTREQVLRTLAQHLDDALLIQLFPGASPGTIREIIAEADSATSTTRQEPAASSSSAAPATPGRCRLFTDGASRGNPGHAGAGAVLFGADGSELAARSSYLGTCTNNVAEYKALLIGLQSARDLGCRSLEIFLDSELIVRQIQGRYKVKNAALKPLFDQVQTYLVDLDEWRVRHVPRAQNARADALANKGIDQREQKV